jgi:putative flippase GtrA
LIETTEPIATTPEQAMPQASGLIDRLQTLWQNKEFKRFAKFFAVGLMGAVIDFTVTHGVDATNVFLPVYWKTPFGFAIDEFGIVGSCGFSAAIISNFIWNRYWVYPDSRSKTLRSQLTTFMLINVVGLIIRTPILELLQNPLIKLAHSALPKLGGDLVDSAGKTLAWATAVIAVMLWNFFINRYWTYNDVK